MRTIRGVRLLSGFVAAAACLAVVACPNPFGLRANIFDPHGVYGTLVVPSEGISPSDGATTSKAMPLLDWADVVGAASYEVEMANSAAALGTVTPVAASASQYQVPAALANGTWYWRVRAVHQDGIRGIWSATWSLAVKVAAPPAAITSFGFVSPAVSGTIDESGHSIAVTVPYGTDLTALVATFTTTGAQVEVGNTVQVSGTTANDFTSPVTYTVVAADGTTQNYLVTVTVAPAPKALTSFGFVSPPVSGTIDQSSNSIAVTVPYGTGLTALVATFVTTGAQVKVGSTVQVSGTTANDFTSPVTYTVVAADGSTASYACTVTVAAPSFLWTERDVPGPRDWYSIASSADGTHLAAVVNGGDIYTSSDSGATWTDRSAAGSRSWHSIASSGDGTRLAAVVCGYGDIYTSSDSGATWTDRSAAGSRDWRSIASSGDGTRLAAVASYDDIYTSSDSGATWTDRSAAGSRGWLSIASSTDGTRLTAVAYGGDIWVGVPVP